MTPAAGSVHASAENGARGPRRGAGVVDLASVYAQMNIQQMGARASAFEAAAVYALGRIVYGADGWREFLAEGIREESDDSDDDGGCHAGSPGHAAGGPAGDGGCGQASAIANGWRAFGAAHDRLWERVLDAHTGGRAHRVLVAMSRCWTVHADRLGDGDSERPCAVASGQRAAWLVEPVRPPGPPGAESPGGALRGCAAPAPDGAPGESFFVCNGVYESLRVFHSFRWYTHLRDESLWRWCVECITKTPGTMRGVVLSRFTTPIASSLNRRRRAAGRQKGEAPQAAQSQCGLMNQFYGELRTALVGKWLGGAEPVAGRA